MEVLTNTELMCQPCQPCDDVLDKPFWLDDNGVKWYLCNQSDCNHKTKNAGHLKTHLASIHNIGVTWHHCNQPDCNYKTKYAGALKIHLASRHDIGVTWHHCNQPDCNHKTKYAGHLKIHLARIHNIGVTWNYCDQPGCEYKSKQTDQLKKHKAGVHDIDVTWHDCDHPGCKHKAKDAGRMRQHKADVHNINVTWHYCNQPGCEYKCKQACSLKTHKANIHNIDVTWTYCDQPGCNHKAKDPSNMRQHKADVHNINVTWHYCNQPGCNHKAKYASNMRQHKADVHDVGEHTCEFCCFNRNTLIEYFCPKWAITSQICRGCHNIVTGKKIRKEKEWSNYIDEHFGTEYLLLTDKSFKSAGGCINERPDKFYLSPELAMLTECDEHQHMYRNGTYECEEERISKIYDEPGICGKILAVIRWNPDAYTLPEGGVYRKLKKAERLELQVLVMNFILAHPEVIAGHVHIFYLLYSPDNPKIAKHYPVSMIYDKSDLKVDEHGKAQITTTMPTQLL